MMIDTNTKMNYAQVAFTKEQSDRPLPVSRRDTKYSSIIYPPATSSSGMASAASLDSNLPPPPPPSHSTARGANAVGHQQPVDSDSPTGNEALYDTPLPAMRMIPDNDPWSPGVSSNEQSRPLPPPTTTDGRSRDPFSEDPFTSSAEEWNDPAAFYDRPPPPRPHPTASSGGPNAHPGASTTNGSSDVHTEEEEIKEELEGELFFEDNSADFTGGSTYEDATEFLIAVRRSSVKKKPEDGHPLGTSEIFAPAAEVYHGEDHNVNEQTSSANDDVSAPYDVPPVLFDHASGQHLILPSSNRLEDADDTGGSSYEYPSALSMYPPARRDGTETGSQEEPTLHMMNYTSKSSSPGLTRHTSATDPRHASSSRQDMPLPPLPTNPSHAQAQSDQPPPPPLPARPPSMKQLRDGSIVRSGSSGGRNQTQQHPPPLPPMNIPRKGGPPQQHAGSTPSSTPEEFPPLPPRKKPNGNHPSPPPNPDSPPTAIRSAANAREDGIMELVVLGYSRSDVVRAMAISKNDSQLALLILKEFGGRY